MSSIVPKELILHIGFNKTASTWLQRYVFPQLAQVHYLGRGREPVPGLRDGWLRQRPAYQVLGLPPAQWQQRAEAAARAFVAAAVDERPGLVSHERMSAPWRFFGERGKPFRHPSTLFESLAQLREAAERIGIERLAVLFLIRRQETYLPSFYAERSDRIGHAGQRDFEAQLGRILDRDYATQGAFLDYAQTVEGLRQVLPAQDLLVMPFERLQQEPECFLRALCSFIGEDFAGLSTRVEPGRRGRQRTGGRPNSWQLRRRRGGVVRPAALRRRLGLDAERTEVTLTAELGERIRSVYRPANQQLAEVDPALAESLATYGYLE
ncbi:hypothetical protein CKO15_01015 [Halorhodospira abdelmalekii]|uniref:hypothetical protein n=1 Tax=Halorhodospira abdelmalekii TaxID=421629 RepID=UPI0019082652|nr:hypothetical protein [Halorhodospira abdelmalekii]MBK1733881.1 hypothetical protein [Halorhodospira abdelmalekii]